jgi:Holliday junction DNA helicase RuvA
VSHIGPDSVIIDIGGVGYRVVVSPALTARLRVGGEASLFIHHLVRDDAQALFGFARPEEPVLRTADDRHRVRIATGDGDHRRASVTRLQMAIVTDDLDVLTSVSGVGRKTAQRIVLELKEKIHAAGIAVGPGAVADSDVVAALESLGYTATEARRAAGSVVGVDGGLDQRIRAALQELARSR